MIPNYSAVKPQTIIRQLLDRIEEGAQLPLSTLIVGARYDLHRYTEPSEREGLSPFSVTEGLLTAPTSVLPYTAVRDTAVVDKAFVKLFGEGIRARYAEIPDAKLEALNRPQNLVLPGPTVDALGIVAGDIARITYDGVTVERRVADLIRELSAASHGSNANKDDGKPAADANNVGLAVAADFDVVTAPDDHVVSTDNIASWRGFTSGARFSGEYGDQYTLTVLSHAVGGSCNLSVTSLYQGALGNITLTDTAGDMAASAISTLGGINLSIDYSAGAVPAPGNVYTFTVLNTYDFSATSQRILWAPSAYPADTTLQITVLSASIDGLSGVVEVRDSVGAYPVRTLTVSGLGVPNVANGVGTFTFLDDSGGDVLFRFHKGDVFTFGVIPELRTGDRRILQLTGPAVTTAGFDITHDIEVELQKSHTGEIPARLSSGIINYTAEDNGVHLNTGSSVYLKLPYSNVSGGFATVVAHPRSSLFVHFRALVPPAEAGEVLPINSPSVLINQLGTIDVDNPLAYGAYAAWSGAQERQIFVAPVASENPAGYEEALRQIQYRQELYVLGTPSSDRDIHNVIQLAVNTASAANRRKFKRAYFSVESPSEIEVLTTHPATGLNLQASVLEGDQGFNRVVFVDGVTLNSRVIRRGHHLRISYAANVFGEANTVYQTYEIDSLISDSELLLKSGPGAAIASPVKAEIWAPPTAEFQADYLSGVFSSYSNRRTPCVWVDRPTDGDGRPLPTAIVSCYIAGLRAAMLPQMGLTDSQIPIVANASGMYSRFTEEQVDRIAASGGFVITQDNPGGPAYVRHQLTTETDKGPLYYEDSIGVNMDEICFAMDVVVTEYRGKYQATDALLRVLEYRIQQLLLERERLPIVTPLVGSQIQEYRDLNLRIHPTIRSKILIDVTLVFALPFNSIEIRVRGTVDQDLGVLEEIVFES